MNLNLDLAAMRRMYHDLCAQFRANPRTGLPTWTLNLQPGDLLTKPLVFVAHDNVECVMEYLDQHANVIAIVNDFRVGELYGRHVCISTDEMIELHRKEPEMILVNSVIGEGAQRYFNRVASQNEIPTLSLLHFYRALRLIDTIRVPVRPSGLMEVNDLLSFFDAALDLEVEHSRIETSLEGTHSKVTLYGLLLQRLTGDSGWHVEVSVDNYAKPYGLDSYIFNSRFFHLSDNEFYIDAGAYRGDTVKLFADSVQNSFRKIHAFEPDPVNFAYLEALVLDRFGSSHKQVLCHQAGVWEKSGKLTMSFTDSDDGPRIASHLQLADATLESNDTIDVDVVALDECLAGERPTLIKFEIEGSEVAALRGARNLIVDNRPKLALSAYHRARDLVDLFQVVESFDAGYRIGLTHHRVGLATMVYYCVPPR